MSSGRDILGAADPASARAGADGGVSGQRGADAGGSSAKAYQQEWASKGHPDVYVPKALRETAPVVTPEQRKPQDLNGLLFPERVEKVFEQLERTLLSKHRDYGPDNIALAPGGPLTGLRVRIHDKVARINHLALSGQKPQHESLEDSFLDLANYAVIAVLVLRRQWPGVK